MVLQSDPLGDPPRIASPHLPVPRVMDSSPSSTCSAKRKSPDSEDESAMPARRSARLCSFENSESNSSSPGEVLERATCLSQDSSATAASAPPPQYALGPPLLPITEKGDFTPRPGFVGLVNLGSTCYMNAVIQCLHAILPLVTYLLGGEHELNETNPLGTGGDIFQSFARLLSSMRLASSLEAIVPREFKKAIDNHMVAFKGTGIQHDAAEFATALLDKLHEDLNRAAMSSGEPPETPECTIEMSEEKGIDRIAAEFWKAQLAKNQSIIVDLFQGQMRSVFKCSSCGHSRVVFEAFNSLILPVEDFRGKPLTDIYDCLREFARPSDLSGDNGWYCAKCSSLSDSTCNTTLWKLPGILMVQLRRFKQLSPTRWSKSSHHVHYPTKEPLNLEKFVSRSHQRDAPTYRLLGVLRHKGLMSGGHYTAFVNHDKTLWDLKGHEKPIDLSLQTPRRAPFHMGHHMDPESPMSRVVLGLVPCSPNGWWFFDDSTVHPLRKEALVDSRDAYILFFVRSGTPVDHKMIPSQRHNKPTDWPHAFDNVASPSSSLSSPEEGL
ncbi:ubiquitin-specific protease doa4 [Perkinsus chesapeaki]|uniref:Ubiquitin carboxyl-terminal hydrolase n=1 Tax=Perkinsus chesapeaki TaxID=330153 RepID=A0A7J6L3Q0_PERCH|nr:ubiquitin-specific protease doa4 [Perkinsus chesapeaki]